MSDHTPPWEIWTPEAERELLCGNADAAAFLHELNAWSHTYDDLIDGDKPMSPERIHRLMYSLWIAVPGNPFYQQYRHLLTPVILTGIRNWQAANQMERSGCEEQLRVAHVIRYSIIDVVLLVVEICGGYDHVTKNAARVRLMFQADTWEHYRSEHHV
jgi:hypothetical protein